MTTKGYTLEQFIHDMEDKLRKGTSEEKILDEGSDLLGRLVSNPECIPLEYRVPSGKGKRPGHGRYLLYNSPDGGLLISSLVWGPGDYIAPHDHHTWGMIGVLDNVLRETRYRRLDDRSRPDYALLEKDRVALSKAGDISLLIPDIDEIHEIHNTDDRPTAEIHVYGKDLGQLKRCLFNLETGKVTERASGTQKYDNE